MVAEADRNSTICVQFPLTVVSDLDQTNLKLQRLQARLNHHLGPWAKAVEVGLDRVKIRAEVYVVVNDVRFLGPARDICLRVLAEMGEQNPEGMVEVWGPYDPNPVILPVRQQDLDAMELHSLEQFFTVVIDVLLQVSCDYRYRPEKWIPEARIRLGMIKIKRELLKPMIAICAEHSIPWKLPSPNGLGDVTLHQIVQSNPTLFPSFHNQRRWILASGLPSPAATNL
jgi:hypothetical protein